MDDFNLRCINCRAFHEYGQWHCYGQRWANRPQASWKSEEDFNPWNPPYNQHYGAQEEPHQGHGSGRERLEELLEGFITRIDNDYKNREAIIKNNEVIIKNLESRFRELSRKFMEESHRPSPRLENVSAITTRSGKILVGVEKGVEKEKMKKKDDEVIVKEVSKEEKVNEEKKSKEGEKNEKAKVPYPNALLKKSLEKQFSKFVAMFKKLQVDIPFSEVLEKMPQYAKFMKEILSKKRRLSEMDETVEMTEECSAILQRKLPTKMKDPGSFTLPVEFEGQEEVRALTDLGASVNLMPLSMFERLAIGELKPTMMTLQLADRSLVTPWGVVEDVLVKVGKFEFPVDFVILDMAEDTKIPLILGRPFLATAKAKIDVAKGMVSLKANGKRKKFKIFELKIKPEEQHDAFLMEMMSLWSDEGLERFFLKEEIAIKKKPVPPKQAKKGCPKKKSLFKKEKVTPITDSQSKVISFVGVNNISRIDGAGSGLKKPQGESHRGFDPG